MPVGKDKIMRIRLITLAVSLLPVLLWLVMQPLGTRFGSLAQTFVSLGQLTSLVGFALMAIVIILTARLGFIERWSQGLNRVFINHHRLGTISFILLLAHPIFLTLRYLAYSTNAAALFLLPSASAWPQNLGTIALLIMIALLVITFYLAWRYDKWKFSHRFLALAFLTSFFHVGFITSDVSRNLFLRGYLLSLGGLALVAYGYRLLVEFGQIGTHGYIVSALRQVAPGVREISLKPRTKNFSYHAGQFAFLILRQEGLSREAHPFSFVSAPREPEIKFAIKELGDYTKTLTGIRVGIPVHVEGPYGTFGHGPKTAAPEIWIAGGIGITPFLSLAKDLARSERHADLYYSVKSEEELAYGPELEALAHKLAPKFRFIPYLTLEQGFLTVDKVEEFSGPLVDRRIYVCGPPMMMKSLREQFVAKGVENKNIYTEEFSL